MPSSAVATTRIRLRAVLISFLVWPALSLFGQTSTTATIDYERHVHPVLAAKCLACHSSEKRSGGLSLATYRDTLDTGLSGATVRPGSSATSLLVQRITGGVEPRMPLGGAPLTPSEIATIRSWIDEGARPTPTSDPAKPKWEAPLALKKPEVPKSPWRDWSDPIDRFVASYLADHGLPEPTLVSDAQFARRAWLDTVGLLPPPDELNHFLADRSENKRRKLVERLLANDTKYAEHWISFWNDLLRNDEGVNYYSESARRKSISKWLLAALESNLSYDRFVSKLLNPTAPTDPDGFLIGVNWRGTVSASQTQALQAAQNTAQIFLGINLKCNSCHDSFINKWKLKEAYALAAYFSSEERLQLYRCDVAQEQYATASFLYPELNRPLPSMRPADRRATAAAIFTDRRNGRMPRTLVNRVWERLLGRGIVGIVDEMDGEPWSPELLDWLASDFVSNGYDIKRLIATIISSRGYQMPAVARGDDDAAQYVFKGPEVRRLTAEQFADAVASITGDWHVAQPSSTVSSDPERKSTLIISGAPSTGAGLASFRQQAAAPAPARAPNRPEPGILLPGNYSREWRIAASNLTRALGRPIRDQVYSTRDTQATTIQAIELVNGETLTQWLARGAKRMLGELPPEPKSLYAREVSSTRTPPGAFEIDVSRSERIYLIVQDGDSTAPDKATPVWERAEFIGPTGAIPLSALRPLDSSDLREDIGPATGGPLRVKLSSVLVYDIAGKGFTRFRASPGLESIPAVRGEIVRARFFVFDRQPSLDRLVPPNPGTPLPAGPVLKNASDVVDRVFWYALGRAPSPAEKQIAEAALQDPERPDSPSAAGLADLLWAVLMKPEFELIY